MIKKGMKVFLSMAMLTTLFTSHPDSFVKADEDVKIDVQVEESDNSIMIGNEFLDRTYSYAKGVVETKMIRNKRVDASSDSLIPGAGSQEFIINTLPTEKAEQPIALDRSGWSITANSSNSASEQASNLLDGNKNTIWHSNQNKNDYPHVIIIDMKESKELKAFSYTPRPTAWEGKYNGTIKDYDLYVSENQTDWGKPISSGAFKMDDNKEIYINFAEAKTGQFIKLIAKSEQYGRVFASGAELNFFNERVLESQNDNVILSSDLVYDRHEINQVEETKGKLLAFHYKPYECNGATWNITMNIVLNEKDFFMRKFIEIRVDEANQKKAKIDSIDLEHLVLPTDLKSSWTRPEAAGTHLTGYHYALGQPVYVNAMFMGTEFPATDNQIVNNATQFLYFSGKSFDELEKTKDGKFVTWQTVIGAARSDAPEVIQSDFFDYIQSIAVKTDFRKQFNSWYDYRLNITPENLDTSFKEMEKGLTGYGVAPLDAYVVDDGWNDYTGDFWGFNKNFPEGLTPTTNLTSNFGSNLGLWMSPRGGYDYPTVFAKQIEAAGNGGFNAQSNDICTLDSRYFDRYVTMIYDWTRKFNLTYFKMDGFAARPCENPHHGHIVGGKNGMYFMSEHWEKWLNAFTSLREQRTADGKALFLNFTTYAWPSPWFLQWANTVFIGNSGDAGVSGTGSVAEKMISYRDDKYYDFVKKRELQFPLSNIYNHDPVYGKQSHTSVGQEVKMSDEEFLKYLYINAARGTALWELYYSYDMLNDNKWTINADVLRWAEDNFDILKNVKYIGKSPTEGQIYGYSSWKDEEGFITLRNPSNAKKSFSVTLDRNIGLIEGAEDLQRSIVMPYTADVSKTTYNYGDTLSVELAPYDMVVYKFGKKDERLPAITNIKNTSDKSITVSFNEKVDVENVDLHIPNYTITSSVLSYDAQTIIATLEEPLEEGTFLTLTMRELSDLDGNIIHEQTADFKVLKDEVIADIKTVDDLQNADDQMMYKDPILNEDAFILKNKQYQLKNNIGLAGDQPFTISMLVKSAGKAAVLYSQEDAYELSINKAGNVEFQLHSLKITSKKAIRANEWNYVSIVKEKNGMLKLYINGVLDCSLYEESNKNSIIEASSLFIGSTSFQGSLSNVKMKNCASSYDMIEKDAAQFAIGDFSVKDIQKSVVPYQVPSLPDTLPVRYESGKVVEAAVAWDEMTETMFSELGNVVIKGVLPELHKEVSANIMVTEKILQDEFNNGELHDIWNIEKELKDHWSLTSTQGILTIQGTQGYNDVGQNNNNNVFLQKAQAEDYVITTKLIGKPTAGYNSGGLLVYKDNDNYIRIARKYVTKNLISFTVENNGQQTHVEMDDTTNGQDMCFAIEKSKDTYSAYYSLDHVTWKKVKATNGNESSVTSKTDFQNVGLYATNGGNVQYDAGFDYFKYLPYSPSLTVEKVEPLKVIINKGDLLPHTLTTNVKFSNGTLEDLLVTLLDYDDSIRSQVGSHSVQAQLDGSSIPVIVTIVVTEQVDKEQLANVIEEAKAVDGSVYTQDSYEVLMKRLATAQIVFDLENATASQVSEAKDHLKKAMEGLMKRADTAALVEAIKKGEDLKLNAYTKDTWTIYQTALDAAKAAIKDISNVSVDQATVLLENLTLAYKGLKEETTLMKSILKSAIDKANAAQASIDFKTLAPSVQALLIAMRNTAQTVYADSNVTNAQCMDAWIDLANALQFLDFQADKAALLSLIVTCKEINTDDYSEGVEEFEAAISFAQSVYDNKNALQESIDEAYNRLDAARNGLKKNESIVDKSLLASMISAIEQQTGDGSKYKQDGNWIAFAKALADANVVVANTAATQEEVDAAITALSKTYLTIRLLPSEEQLAELNGFIAAVTGINRKNFTKAQLHTIDETASKVKMMIDNFDSKKFPFLQKAMVDTLELINDLHVKEIENSTTMKSAKDGINAPKPNTGDNQNVAGILLMILLSGCGVVFMQQKHRKLIHNR